MLLKLNGHWFINLPWIRTPAVNGLPPNRWQIWCFESILLPDYTGMGNVCEEAGGLNWEGLVKHAVVRRVLSSIKCHKNWLLAARFG